MRYSAETASHTARASGKRARWMISLLVIALIAPVCAWLLLTQPLLGVRLRPTGIAVDPHRLETHVRRLSETLSPRDVSRPAQLDRVAAYIHQEFAACTSAVTEQPFPAGDGIYRNVIATFGPETGETIVIGAHYDAFGPYPGADDNASGVAGLIELARLLGKAPPPPLRVQLVAFTLEEPPIYDTQEMGSVIHAASLRNHGVHVRAMISLEMIGYFTDTDNSQRYPLPLLSLFYPRQGNYIGVVGRLSEIGLGPVIN